MAFLFNIQLLPGLCVFPGWSSDRRAKAHSTVPIEMALIPIFVCLFENVFTFQVVRITGATFQTGQRLLIQH